MKNAIVNVINNLSHKSANRKTLNADGFVSARKFSVGRKKIFAPSAKILLFVLISLWLTGGWANAASFTVNTAAADASDANIGDGICDSDLAAAGTQCTLRAATQEANVFATPDSITISNAASIINLTIADLYIVGSVSITGNGARNTIVQRAAGATNFRVFFIQAPGATIDISGITIAGGNLGANDGGGAGILHNSSSSTLNLDGVTIRNNNAVGLGGGIFNIGTLNVVNSTISNNSGLQGGGINNNSGTANISNSTISDNTATNNGVAGSLGLGGGIINFATITINNATISNNTATTGGGGFNDGSTQNSSFRNTIVAANTAPDDSDFGGAVTSQGNNLIGRSDGSNGFTNNVNGDKVGTNAAPINPQLGSLQNNGGQTDTRALLFGSPAVDAGNNCVVTASCPAANPPQPLVNDQRGAGYSRQLDGDNNGIPVVDIGAFEAIAPTAAAANVAGRVVNGRGRGISRASVIMIDLFGQERTATTNSSGYYIIADVPVGATYVINVRHKNYDFAPQVVSVNDDLTEFNIIALK